MRFVVGARDSRESLGSVRPASVESRFVLRGRYAAQDQSADVAAEAGELSFEVRFLKTNQKYLLSF